MPTICMFTQGRIGAHQEPDGVDAQRAECHQKVSTAVCTSCMTHAQQWQVDVSRFHVWVWFMLLRVLHVLQVVEKHAVSATLCTK